MSSGCATGPRPAPDQRDNEFPPTVPGSGRSTLAFWVIEDDLWLPCVMLVRTGNHVGILGVPPGLSAVSRCFVSQHHRLDGEQVANAEKIYSIFEPHTELIKRAARCEHLSSSATRYFSPRCRFLLRCLHLALHPIFLAPGHQSSRANPLVMDVHGHAILRIRYHREQGVGAVRVAGG